MGAGFVQIVINTSIIILELITWKITVLNVDLECKKRGINKMDDPIISPWVIYLIDKIDMVGILFFIAWIAGCLGGILCLVEGSSIIYTQEEQKIWNKRARKALLVSIILFIVAMLMPNSTTLTKMIIAQQITPNNITATKELTTEIMKDTVNFIADKAIEVIKEVKK